MFCIYPGKIPHFLNINTMSLLTISWIVCFVFPRWSCREDLFFLSSFFTLVLTSNCGHRHGRLLISDLSYTEHPVLHDEMNNTKGEVFQDASRAIVYPLRSKAARLHSKETIIPHAKRYWWQLLSIFAWNQRCETRYSSAQEICTRHPLNTSWMVWNGFSLSEDNLGIDMKDNVLIFTK